MNTTNATLLLLHCQTQQKYTILPSSINNNLHMPPHNNTNTEITLIC